MLQQKGPEDFVLATGEMHRVREFVEKAFRAVGIEIKLTDPPHALNGKFFSDHRCSK